MSARAAAAALLAGVAACSEHRVLDLGFDRSSAFFGFRCRPPGESTIFAARGVMDGRFRACVYFDFVSLPGVPLCGPNGIADYCETHACAALSSPVVEPLQLDVPAPTSGINEFVVGLLRELDGTVLTDDGPDGPVMMRAVVVAGLCDATPPFHPYDPARVMGCAVTCPLELDTVDGQIPFGLPSLTDECSTSVLACATDDLRP